MVRLAVFQSDGLRHLLSHTDFLACAVYEFELAFREEDGQRNTRESATSAKVQNLSAWSEVDHLGDGQRVENMVLVQIVDVLARYNVNLSVPLTIERIKSIKLSLLFLRQLGEIFQYDVGCHCSDEINEFLSIDSILE